MSVLTLNAAVFCLAAKPAYIPLGANIEDYGYVLSSSEKLEFLYRSTKKQAPQELTMEYILTDLTGNVLRQGDATGKYDATGSEYKFMVADQLGSLTNGTYQLKTRIKNVTDWFPYAFTFKPAVSDAEKVVCLFDDMDPEGWGHYLTAPIRHHMELLKSFPANGQADLALLCCYSTNNTEFAADIPQLENWVKAGGKLIAWGQVNQNFAGLLPVKFEEDRELPYRNFGQMSAITLTDAGRHLLRFHNRWEGSAFAQLRCAPVAGSAVLAKFSDGGPAIVMRHLGKGTVIFFCGELMPGPLFADIYCAAEGISPDFEDIYTAPEVPKSFSETSIGRHGYNTYATGVFLRNFGANKNIFGIWNHKLFELYFSGSDDAESTCEVEDSNWCYRNCRLTGGPWGGGVNLHVPLCAAHMMIEPIAGQRSFTLKFSSGMTYNRCAYSSAGGMITRCHLDPSSSPIDPSGMQSNWLLLWGSENNATAPLLLVFSTSPQQVAREADGLKFTFSAPLKFMSFTFPYGIKMLDRNVVSDWDRDALAEWDQVLPQELVNRIEMLHRMMITLPIRNTETYDVTDGGVAIHNRFNFETFTDIWNTDPLYFAPYPPVASLAAENGVPVHLDESATTLCAALDGPFRGIADAKECSYTLPRVDYAYPLRTSESTNICRDKYTEILRQQVRADLNYKLSKGITYQFAAYGNSSKLFDHDISLFPGYLENKNRYEFALFDLYRYVGSAFGMQQFIPYLTPEYNDVRGKVRSYLDMNNIGLNFFKYKTLVRHRYEPYTQRSYAINFIYPVTYTREGFRIFNDNNESFGLVLYALYMNGLLGGDWDIVQTMWPLIDILATYPETFNDWAYMSGYYTERCNGNRVDMLNSEYPGWLGYLKIAEKTGDRKKVDFGNYAASKAAISAVARLFFPGYLRENSSALSPGKWKNAQITPGWGTGFLLPISSEEIERLGPLTGKSSGAGKIIRRGVDMWDTSKGTPPEMALLYGRLSRQAIDDYESFLWDKIGFFATWPRVSYKAMLGADKDWIRSKIMEYGNSPFTQPESLTYQTLYTPNYMAMIMDAYQKTLESSEMK